MNLTPEQQKIKNDMDYLCGRISFSVCGHISDCSDCLLHSDMPKDVTFFETIKTIIERDYEDRTRS